MDRCDQSVDRRLGKVINSTEAELLFLNDLHDDSNSIGNFF